ncbi:MAG: isochorismatase family protein [Pseudomonadota bacterium]
MSIALTSKNSQVLIIDIQGRLSEVVVDADSMFSRLIKLIKIAKMLGVPTVHVEHCVEKLGKTSAKIMPLLHPENCIQKNTFSVTNAPEFERFFQIPKYKFILVCGIEAHVCVYQSVREMLSLGFNVVVIEDCMSSRNNNDKRLAIAQMRQLGAIVMSTEMVCFDWVESPSNPHFSEFMTIIK